MLVLTADTERTHRQTGDIERVLLRAIAQMVWLCWAKHPNIMTHKLCWAWRLLGDQRGFVIWHQWMRGEETWLYLMPNYSASHCFGVTPQKAKNDATPAWGTPFGGSVTPLKWSDTTPLDVIFCYFQRSATEWWAIDFANRPSLSGL